MAHEFGHFVMARKFGCKVEEFGFGFPPRIFGVRVIKGKKLQKIAEEEKLEVEVDEGQNLLGQEVVAETIIDKTLEVDQLVETKEKIFFWGAEEDEDQEKPGTVYSLNWIPLGGFVKIKGEDGEKRDQGDSFGGKKIWQRAIMLVAGVLMNVVLAAILLSIGFSFGLPTVLPTDQAELGRATVTSAQTQIYLVAKNSPAEKAGVAVGDAVLKIDDQSFNDVVGVQNYIASKDGQNIDLLVKRGNEEKLIVLTPTYLAEVGHAGIGVGLARTGLVSYPWYLAAVKGVEATGILIVTIVVAFYEIIKNLIVGAPTGVEVAGPVGIAVLTGQVARMGVVYILQFIALLSVNLAIINILPLPALDGGRLLFLLIEKIRRRPVSQKIEGWVHTVGFSLLMLLMVFVTYRDVVKWGSGLWQKLFG